MGRNSKTSTVSSRAEEFKQHGMYVFDRSKQIMMCKYCNETVNWPRKSVVDHHIDSKRHKDKKKKYEAASAAEKKRQASVGDSLKKAEQAKADREEFIKSTVHAFAKANIPLHKLDHPAFRKWLQKYTPGGGNLPTARNLRKKYLPLIKEEYDAVLKAKLVGKKIMVMSDETTNRKGEAALVTLFKIMPTEDQEPILVMASVKVLEACTGDQTSKAILQTLQEFDVVHANVVGLVSDSAPYMTLCARLLRELGFTNMVHIQCYARKLDKIAKVFSDKLSRLNQCVSKTKKLFKNTRKRKHKYLKFLAKTYSFTKAKEPKLFPLPIMTRWGSWRKSVEYLRVYVKDVAAYAKTIPASESVISVDYFKSLTQADLNIIEAEAAFVVDYCTPVTELLLEVEGSKHPMSHLLYSKITDVRKTFSLLKNAKDVKDVLLKDSLSSLAALSDAKRKNLESRIKQVGDACCKKIDEFKSEDPAKDIFKASQALFDPRKIVLGSTTEQVLVESKTALDVLLSPIPLPNFKVLYSLLKDSVKELVNAKVQNGDKDKYKDTVCDALLSMKEKYPAFVSACRQVLHIPVSNVDSERAFSGYGDIHTPKRNRLKTENTEIFMCLYFGAGDDLGADDDLECVHSDMDKDAMDVDLDNDFLL